MSEQKKRFAPSALCIAAGVLPLISMASGCDRKRSSSEVNINSLAASQPAPRGIKDLATELDAVCAQAIHEPNHAEAREWLAPGHKNHRTIHPDRVRMAELVENLYSAGAKEVDVTGIQSNGQDEVPNAMIVVLPEDRSARKAIFGIEFIFRHEAGLTQTPTPDVGQNYLRFSLA